MICPGSLVRFRRRTLPLENDPFHRRVMDHGSKVGLKDSAVGLVLWVEENGQWPIAWLLVGGSICASWLDELDLQRVGAGGDPARGGADR